MHVVCHPKIVCNCHAGTHCPCADVLFPPSSTFPSSTVRCSVEGQCWLCFALTCFCSKLKGNKTACYITGYDKRENLFWFQMIGYMCVSIISFRELQVLLSNLCFIIEVSFKNMFSHPGTWWQTDCTSANFCNMQQKHLRDVLGMNRLLQRVLIHS